ncbi:TATA element modulatory factor [Eublepharis macularius]|uniref:TATA element modulatory factor n=1 Tax=Eublepharis macularius TaxID=481883 RepID=A0AA97J6Y2_EUBMA|nr:TATA element modulatory factor [Eublepharis macularius]
MRGRAALSRGADGSIRVRRFSLGCRGAAGCGARFLRRVSAGLKKGTKRARSRAWRGSVPLKEMSWFNASQLSSFAKQALSQAQKSIDRVLDIQAEEEEEGEGAADRIAPPRLGEAGTNLLTSGGWDTSAWGLNSDTETQNQPVSSPAAITKPVRRTVVDESDNFFSAFLSPTDVQNVQQSSVVSKPPTKSQWPKEEVKSTLQDSLHSDSLEASVETESKDFSVIALVELKNVSDSQEQLEENSSVLDSEGKNEEDETKVTDQEVPAENVSVAESTDVKPNSGSDGPAHMPEIPAQSLPAETKNAGLESKERKSEDRQSNTPSPPVSTFSSGTSTTSDIEVLDHESVISESSVSSRQEAADSKASLHLMQTSFQLLSASACTEYNRLDDFQKLTESCSSSDAFERIDSFSVQSLDSRSVSEINSDDELTGRGCLSASVTISPLTPKNDAVDLIQSESDQIVSETLALPPEESEMEESGRSATPVNSEQPDVLVVPIRTVEEQTPKEEVVVFRHSADKLSSVECEKEELCKIIDSLAEKLEMRENRLLSVSKEKACLEEAYDNLKDEIFRMKEDSSSISSLKEEFAQRIADAEKKVQLACKERDTAKKEVKTLKEELATRLNSNETAELLKERDEQIKGLMEEGEKLSKQQLQNSNIIKKLRAKEKERENTNTKQSKKIKELEEELQLLKQVLDGKEEVEKQHRESIKQLNSLVERQEKDLSRLQVELEDLEERNRSVQAALDNAYRDLADLHKANATKDSEAQEAALSHERKAKEELALALEKAQEEAHQQQEALAIQVTDLRLALQRAEQQTARKEDYLLQEIGELQQRLQEAETRNQELSQSVTSATRPLLRQIENLQATLGAQTTSWEKLEKNLSDRLGESQTALAAQAERERAATEELLSNKIQLSATESQNSLLRQENSRLQAQLEAEKARLKKLENENNRYEVELENLKEEYVKTVEEAKKEKMLLSTQLEMEKMKVEQEKKKAIFVQETAREKERKLFTPSATETVSSTPSLSRSSSVSGVDMAGLQASFISQDESHDHSFGSLSTSGSNLYDAVRMGAGSSIIENLQSQLKLRDGEISHLQLEIGNLERTRSIMAEELVKLTNQNDDLEEKVKEIPKLRTQLRDLDQRYNTILQMYGEKAEEAEELRLDLEDVKNMYKTQIDELLKQRHS